MPTIIGMSHERTAAILRSISVATPTIFKGLDPHLLDRASLRLKAHSKKRGVGYGDSEVAPQKRAKTWLIDAVTNIASGDMHAMLSKLERSLLVAASRQLKLAACGAPSQYMYKLKRSEPILRRIVPLLPQAPMSKSGAWEKLIAAGGVLVSDIVEDVCLGLAAEFRGVEELRIRADESDGSCTFSFRLHDHTGRLDYVHRFAPSERLPAGAPKFQVRAVQAGEGQVANERYAVWVIARYSPSGIISAGKGGSGSADSIGGCMDWQWASHLFTLGTFSPAAVEPYHDGTNRVRQWVRGGNGNLFQGSSCAASSEPLQAAVLLLLNTVRPIPAAIAINELCAAHRRHIDRPFSLRGPDVGVVLMNLLAAVGVASSLSNANCFVRDAARWSHGFPWDLSAPWPTDRAETIGGRGRPEFVRILCKHIDSRKFFDIDEASAAKKAATQLLQSAL